MSLIDNLRQEIGAYFEQRRKRISPVAILDPDNQVLSIGEAVLETDRLVGTFWPRKISRAGLARAALLRRPSGRSFVMHDFKECHCLSETHYHFRFER